MNTEARTRGSGSLGNARRITGGLQRPTGPQPPVQEPDVRQTTGSSPTASHRLTPAEFNTAMVHFYRGEVQRANTWRNRLDTTTNWAVLTTGATLSFAFSAPVNPHFVIIINTILVALFLFMEARRYRYYEIWSSRVRMLETGYFVEILKSGGAQSNTDWAERLANDLSTPRFTISEWEAVGRRLRRNYLWIFFLLAACWNLKIYLHPRPAISFDAFIQRATVGVLPGWIVFSIGVLFNGALFIFALATVRLREATGEVLPQYSSPLQTFRHMTDWTREAARERRVTLRRARRARARTRATTTTGEWKRSDKDREKEETLI